VIIGGYTVSDLSGKPVPTLQGEAMRIEREDFDPNKYRVEQRNFDASIDIANVFASNGVMHFIDKVLMPPTLQVSSLFPSQGLRGK